MSGRTAPVVLQCGFPKSGNYGVYKLLEALLSARDRFVSYKRASGLARVVEGLCAEQALFPEAAQVDSFSFASGRCELELPHPACRRLPVDPELLFGTSTLLWTHDPATVAARPELAAVTHRVYVARDGRDVLDSLAHHVTRPEILRLHPEYRHRSAGAVYADRRLFERYARRWAEHVRSLLQDPGPWLVVRLEDLMDDAAGVAARIGDALDLPVDARRLGDGVAFEALAQRAPGHLRRGGRGAWRDAFDAGHARVFREVAGDALVALGYDAGGTA